MHIAVDNFVVDNFVVDHFGNLVDNHYYCNIADIVLGCYIWVVVVVVLGLPLASTFFFDCQVVVHEISNYLAPTSSSPGLNIRDLISRD